jgi:hypothetical protein
VTVLASLHRGCKNRHFSFYFSTALRKKARTNADIIGGNFTAYIFIICIPPQQVNSFQPNKMRTAPNRNHQNAEGTLAIIMTAPLTAKATPAIFPTKTLSPSAFLALLISSPLALYYAKAQQGCESTTNALGHLLNNKTPPLIKERILLFFMPIDKNRASDSSLSSAQ